MRLAQASSPQPAANITDPTYPLTSTTPAPETQSSPRSDISGAKEAIILCALGTLGGFGTLGYVISTRQQRMNLINSLLDNTPLGTFSHELATNLKLAFYNEYEKDLFKNLAYRTFQLLNNLLKETTNPSTLAALVSTKIHEDMQYQLIKECNRQTFSNTKWPMYILMQLVTDVTQQQVDSENPLSTRSLLTSNHLETVAPWDPAAIRKLLTHYTQLHKLNDEAAFTKICNTVATVTQNLPKWSVFAVTIIIDDLYDTADTIDADQIYELKRLHTELNKLPTAKTPTSTRTLAIQQNTWDVLMRANKLTLQTQIHLAKLGDIYPDASTPNLIAKLQQQKPIAEKEVSFLQTILPLLGLQDTEGNIDQRFIDIANRTVQKQLAQLRPTPNKNSASLLTHTSREQVYDDIKSRYSAPTSNSKHECSI